MDDTNVGTAQAEDPLGKAFFFTKLAEAVAHGKGIHLLT